MTKKEIIFHPRDNKECDYCGIRAFAHIHRGGTLPKDFERVEEVTKSKCNCSEASCPENCKRNHTHKTFSCRQCEPIINTVHTCKCGFETQDGREYQEHFIECHLGIKPAVAKPCTCDQPDCNECYKRIDWKSDVGKEQNAQEDDLIEEDFNCTICHKPRHDSFENDPEVCHCTFDDTDVPREEDRQGWEDYHIQNEYLSCDNLLNGTCTCGLAETIRQGKKEAEERMVRLAEEAQDEILCQRHRTVYGAMRDYMEAFKKKLKNLK